MTGQAKVGRALLVFSWLGGALVVNGCGTNFTCEDSKTCSTGGTAGSGTGGSAGGKQGSTGGAASGKGGSAGSAGASGDTGGEASGGTSGSDAGAGTTGGGSDAGGDSGRGGSSGTSGDSGSGGDDDPGMVCGNGKVEGDEECDDGEDDNGEGKACNAKCVANICGDGDQGPDEGCDDGEDNGLGLLRCAPDCSRVIEIKHIVIGDPMEDEYFQPDPIAKVDATCPSGYKALFSYGTDRRATTVPFKSVNSIDWVLTPYTYYVNQSENLVWMTRDVALLGVENGAFIGLDNYIFNSTYAFVSNLNVDGTNRTSKNCQGWSVVSSLETKAVGSSLLTDEGYLETTELECGYQVLVYCVEQ
jgi:hypothetical protein